MQKLFVDEVLKEEQHWYEKEGLEMPKISYFDNITVLGRIWSKNYFTGM